MTATTKSTVLCVKKLLNKIKNTFEVMVEWCASAAEPFLDEPIETIRLKLLFAKSWEIVTSYHRTSTVASGVVTTAVSSLA